MKGCTTLWRVMLVLCAALAGPELFSAAPQAVAAEVADLQEQLENGLRTKRRQDVEFLKQVVLLVKENRLPLKDVVGILKWARPKRPHPFPYFREAMRRLARTRGIPL